MLKRIALAAPFLVTGALPTFAHIDPSHGGSFLAGLSHPLFGLDHILAMVAVGLWAATIGGRAVLLIPAAFVGTMAVGYVTALSGLQLPLVEPMILASVVALGLLIAAAVRLPAGIGAVIVAIFALFHGHAHGGELGIATALSFGLGFAIATAVLHGGGIGLGLALGSGVDLRATLGKAIARIVGGLTAAGGLVLAFN